MNPRSLLITIGATALGFALVVGVTARTTGDAAPLQADAAQVGVAASATGPGIDAGASSARGRAVVRRDSLREGS